MWSVSIVHLDTGGGGEGGSDPPQDEAAFLEALRLRAAESLERAYRFLETRPDPWALLRAQVLCEARPTKDLAQKLADRQREDGSLPLHTLVSGGGLGFPPIDVEGLDPEAASLVGTLEALLMVGDARGLHAEWVEPAVRYLESRQAPDGAYRLSVGPVVAAEANDDEDVFFTGMIAGLLGRTPVSRTSQLEAAGARSLIHI